MALDAAEYFLHLVTMIGGGVVIANAVWLVLGGDSRAALLSIIVAVLLLIINLGIRWIRKV